MTNVVPEMETQTTIEPEVVNPVPKMYSEEEYSRLLSTNERLLEESKKHKANKQKVEEELLIAEGKKDEIIKRQKDELDEARREKKNYAITQALAVGAQERGLEDWDYLYNLADHDVIYDEDTGTVSGVKEFYDNCEKDERLKARFFQKPIEPVQTNNFTPSNNNNGPKFDYKTQPLEYLKDISKNSPEKYQLEVARMQREGLIQ